MAITVTESDARNGISSPDNLHHQKAAAATNGTTTAAAAPPTAITARLIDPATLSAPVPPVFPLTLGGLHAFARYRDAAIPGVGAALEAREARPRGSHLCFITTATPALARTWSSVQAGVDEHVELNSALVYMNHSCRPSVELHMRGDKTKKAAIGDSNGAENGNNNKGDGGEERNDWPAGAVGEVRVARDRDLAAGDELTFFYPSTEWGASRPFTCLCGAGEGVCIGVHRGGAHLPRALLERYHLNAHVQQLLAEREAAGNGEL